MVAEASAPHPPTTPPRSEQDPRDWWRALTAALGQVAAHLSSVAAISVGGQGHGLVLLDAAATSRSGLPSCGTTPNPRPTPSIYCEGLPADEWVARTGSVPGPALTVSKLAWTRRCHPEALERTAHIMLPADYLVYRLGGRSVTERGGSSGTGYFDPVGNRWDWRLADLAAPGLAWDRLLPAVIGSGDAAAEMPNASESGKPGRRSGGCGQR